MLVSSPLSRRTVLKRSGIGALAPLDPCDRLDGRAGAGPRRGARAAPQHVAAAHRPEGRLDGGPELQVDGVADLAGAARDAGLRDLDEAFVVSFSVRGDGTVSSGLHELRHGRGVRLGGAVHLARSAARPPR